MKKRQENKQEKTIQAHEKAFKAAERKTRLQLSQVTDYQTKLTIYLIMHVCLVFLLTSLFLGTVDEN